MLVNFQIIFYLKELLVVQLCYPPVSVGHKLHWCPWTEKPTCSGLSWIQGCRSQMAALNWQDRCAWLLKCMTEQISNQNILTCEDLWWCPVGHSISKSEIGALSTKFLLHLYKQKSCRSSEHKSNLHHKKTQSPSMNSQYWASSQTNILNERKYTSLQKGLHYYAKIYICNLSSSFPQKNLQTFTELCIGEKKMKKLFRHNVHLFGLTLIPDISKCHSSFSSHSRSLWRSAD